MGDISRLVTLSAVRRRREIGAVGFDEDTVDGCCAEYLAQFAGLREGGDAGHREIETQRQRGLGEGRSRGKAMHHATVGTGAILVREDTGHIVIGVAGMDDEWKTGRARGLDMDAKALLL